MSFTIVIITSHHVHECSCIFVIITRCLTFSTRMCTIYMFVAIFATTYADVACKLSASSVSSTISAGLTRSSMSSATLISTTPCVVLAAPQTKHHCFHISYYWFHKCSHCWVRRLDDISLTWRVCIGCRINCWWFISSTFVCVRGSPKLVDDLRDNRFGTVLS